MKRINLLFVLLFITNIALSQTKRSFISFGGSKDVHNVTTLSGEIGRWGITSRWSYSATFDYMPSDNSKVVGLKPYYTVADNKKDLSVMVYVAPKFNINSSDFIVEEGLSLNYQFHNDFIASLTGCAQNSNFSPFLPAIGISVIYLFKNKK